MFSELLRIADIVRSAFHYSANLLVSDHCVLGPSNSDPTTPRDYPEWTGFGRRRERQCRSLAAAAAGSIRRTHPRASTSLAMTGSQVGERGGARGGVKLYLLARPGGAFSGAGRRHAATRFGVQQDSGSAGAHAPLGIRDAPGEYRHCGPRVASESSASRFRAKNAACERSRCALRARITDQTPAAAESQLYARRHSPGDMLAEPVVQGLARLAAQITDATRPRSKREPTKLRAGRIDQPA